MTFGGHDALMEQITPQGLTPDVTETWHVDFHMSYEPGALSPSYTSCQVSRRVPGTDPQQWHIEGISTFEGPALVVPRVGADLIPYLIYHIDSLKSFLVEEHVVRVFSGRDEKIGSDVGVAVQPPGTEPVYQP